MLIEGDNGTFIGLEMIKRHIRLIWNLGGTTQSLTHPALIEHINLTEHRAWYHIQASRIMNIGTLVVKQILQGGQLSNSTMVTNSSDLEHTLFSQTSVNQVWVGGVPDRVRSPEIFTDPGLGIVINWLNVDKKPLGLWNYDTSSGKCEGALEGPQLQTSSSGIRHFNGEGYSNITIGSTGRPFKIEEFHINIDFKTLDEHALLFLAVDETNVSHKTKLKVKKS